MFNLFSAVNYKDQSLYNKVKTDADKKFAKNSYVKNLWILKEYKKRGGKVSFEGKKPKNKAIQKQVKGSEVIIHVNYAEAAEHAGKKVHLNKPFRTPKGPKKFAVYTKNGSGKVVIVRFGDPNLSIKRDDPARRKNFRARMRCDNPGPKWKARYWACQTWRADKSVKDITGEEIIDWDNLPSQEDLFGNNLPHFDLEEIEENCSC